MAKKGKVNKALLNRRWREINDILAELANLHVWPIDRDIADLARALVELWGRGGERLAPPRLYLLKARPFVAMGDVGFDNGSGNGSLFQESAEE